MRIFKHTIIVLLFVMGCTVNRDLTEYDITPGYGISNLVTVVNTTPQIRRAVHGVIVKSDTSGFYGSIPWLGAEWEGRDETEQVYRIYFLIDPSVKETGSKLKIQRFRGTLAGSVSLVEPKALQRKTLVDLFGKPERFFDLQSTFTNMNDLREMWQKIQACLQHGESVSTLTAPATEVLYYPQSGIKFAMESNVVYTLEVWKKFEPSQTGNIVKRSSPEK
ncbi:MAG: hypothetical protein NTY53_02850 [Kiritimatiellaeota bacterium]|nr:hypothetical protein [Kiritimatiellota bacterium]